MGLALVLEGQEGLPEPQIQAGAQLCGSEDDTVLLLLKNRKIWDFLGSPEAKTPCSQCRGASVQSLVRKLDPSCRN